VHDPVEAKIQIGLVELEQLLQQGFQLFELLVHEDSFGWASLSAFHDVSFPNDRPAQSSLIALRSRGESAPNAQSVSPLCLTRARRQARAASRSPAARLDRSARARPLSHHALCCAVPALWAGPVSKAHGHNFAAAYLAPSPAPSAWLASLESAREAPLRRARRNPCSPGIARVEFPVRPNLFPVPTA
jgi:hypothetical protein